LAKPATVTIGTPLARPAMAPSEASAAKSISPATIAGMMSGPFGNMRSSMRTPCFGQISFMYETAP
jgi:hypothetical protein